MAKYKLTALIVSRAIPRDEHYMLGDGNCLYLKVYPTNRKQWVLRKTSKGCSMIKVLGEYPEMSLGPARLLLLKIKSTKMAESHVLNIASYLKSLLICGSRLEMLLTLR